MPAIEYRDRVLAFLTTNGPSLPMHIAKEVNTSLLMASAMLSEMVSAKIIKLSHLKVGGSPLYFAPGHEIRLQQFVDRLSAPERQAYEQVRATKVLRDSHLTPQMRVALKGIKDFAVPLEVSYGNQKEIFWRWYLVSDTQAEPYIRAMLEPKRQPVAQKIVVPPQIPAAPQRIRPPLQKITPPLPKTAPPAPKIPPQQKVVAPPKAVQQRPQPRVVHKPDPIISSSPSQTTIQATAVPEDDPFLAQIRAYCATHKITILDVVCIKKKSEYELVLQLPSPVGSLTYWCKAKNKAKLNEGDLSTAFVQGQRKQLPVMLLTPGTLSKKAEAMLIAELRGLSVAKMQ